jgi:hypothetical protein
VPTCSACHTQCFCHEQSPEHSRHGAVLFTCEKCAEAVHAWQSLSLRMHYCCLRHRDQLQCLTAYYWDLCDLGEHHPKKARSHHLPLKHVRIRNTSGHQLRLSWGPCDNLWIWMYVDNTSKVKSRCGAHHVCLCTCCARPSLTCCML